MRCANKADIQMTIRFDGETYDHERDASRLAKQYKLVFELMQDGEWRVLRGISSVTGAPEASVSARLRDMRKKKFGSHVIEKRHIEKGLFQYRLLVNKGDLESQI